jgi:hypothetical protein
VINDSLARVHLFVLLYRLCLNSTTEKEKGMKRNATYRLMVTRRERMYVNDEFDHSLMLVEMEGEPIDYQVGVAGEFVSRRSVTFHDRRRGSGPMKGYTVTTFEEGAIHSLFEGERDSESKLTTGAWEITRGLGKLAGIKGNGTFQVKAGEAPREYIIEVQGDYEI